MLLFQISDIVCFFISRLIFGLISIIGIEQWRAAITCFHPKCVSTNFVTYDEGIDVLFSLLCCLYTIVITCVKKLSFSCVYIGVLHAICSMKRFGEYLEVSTIFWHT